MNAISSPAAITAGGPPAISGSVDLAAPQTKAPVASAATGSTKPPPPTIRLK